MLVRTTHTRPARPGVWLPVIALLAWITGCGLDTDAGDTELAIDRPTANDALEFAMAATALDGLATGDVADAVVVVPSDEALLELDADALADLIADAALPDLLRRSVVRAGFELPLEDGDLMLLGDGTNVRVTAVGDQLFVDDVRLLTITDHAGATVLVVDGLVVDP